MNFALKHANEIWATAGTTCTQRNSILVFPGRCPRIARTWHWRWQRGLHCRTVLLAAIRPVAGRWAGWVASEPTSQCCWSAGTLSRPAASAARCSWSTAANRRALSTTALTNANVTFPHWLASRTNAVNRRHAMDLQCVPAHLGKGAGGALTGTHLETPFNRHIQSADHTGRHHGCRGVGVLRNTLH